MDARLRRDTRRASAGIHVEHSERYDGAVKAARRSSSKAVAVVHDSNGWATLQTTGFFPPSLLIPRSKSKAVHPTFVKLLQKLLRLLLDGGELTSGDLVQLLVQLVHREVQLRGVQLVVRDGTLRTRTDDIRTLLHFEFTPISARRRQL